ncbi:MAG: hypothetical protein Q4F67_05410, partial [Propionibacteriaceae bacterium]|nr:hypothetical protein [Propionibacteriaceae bacterium]
ERAAQVAEQTQDALARSASELESVSNSVAERSARQFEKNVGLAADQTVAASQRVADEADKAAAKGEEAAESARQDTRQAGARARKAADSDK